MNTNALDLLLSFQSMSYSVCNFQSTKVPVELNNLFPKFFGYITWFAVLSHQTRHWATCKRDLYVKSYCFFKAIAQRFKNYKLYYFWMITLMKNVNIFQTANVQPKGVAQHLLDFLLDVFCCQFQPRVAQKSVASKKACIHPLLMILVFCVTRIRSKFQN